MAMEAIPSPVTRWAWMEVDLEAIRSNLRAFSSFTAPGTLICAVIKADAYGHGAIPVARACKAAGANWFAVATVDEAVELREAGIREPILILAQPPVSSVDILVSNHITPAVYDDEFAMHLGEAARRQGTEAEYHLAIDTGMDRIGVPYHRVGEVVRVLDCIDGIRMTGVFTHFATADRVSDWDFSLQLKRFNDSVQLIRDFGMDPGIVHCANTPSIVLHPETHMDMVRVGVGLYGLHPADTTRGRIELKQAMSIRARVTRVETPAVGAGVGYGMTYRVPNAGVQIATLPLGYADGYSRSLSNYSAVLYRGRRVRQVGNVCMDQMMIEVNPKLAMVLEDDIEPIEVGDVVTLLGSDGDETISTDELAATLGTINYEVACLFGIRLPKVYL